MSLYERMQSELQALSEAGNLRSLPDIIHQGNDVIVGGQKMLNLSSNDYLGLASREDLRLEFMNKMATEPELFSSSSSRLLTGNFTAYQSLEKSLCRLFNAEAALVFNSGYHANTGILPAICTNETLILADKLVHASLIDGIRLSAGKFIRYRHNDYAQLERLLQTHHKDYKQIIIVTESIFSMDGDVADLNLLIGLKKAYDNVYLYVDEAHAFGVRGENGLGMAEELNCMHDIDFLVGTFGKALASTGAYIICKKVVRDYLINRMRTLIFTTALPPVCVAWTDFLLNKLPDFKEERRTLKTSCIYLKAIIEEKGFVCPSTSHILPLIIGKSSDAIKVAKALQKEGFYALPVRPPTVPEGTSRIRFSLTAAITINELEKLKPLL